MKHVLWSILLLAPLAHADMVLTCPTEAGTPAPPNCGCPGVKTWSTPDADDIVMVAATWNDPTATWERLGDLTPQDTVAVSKPGTSYADGSAGICSLVIRAVSDLLSVPQESEPLTATGYRLAWDAVSLYADDEPIPPTMRVDYEFCERTDPGDWSCSTLEATHSERRNPDVRMCYRIASVVGQHLSDYTEELCVDPLEGPPPTIRMPRTPDGLTIILEFE